MLNNSFPIILILILKLILNDKARNMGGIFCILVENTDVLKELMKEISLGFFVCFLLKSC